MKITIRAEKGKWLTDGKNYGTTISLADNMDINKYYEITDAEYQVIQKQMEEIESETEEEW